MINIDTRLLDQLREDEFWLLCQILKRCNADLVCWPSNKTLCADTGWSLRNLQRVKGQLLDKKLIISKKRFLDDSQSSNSYLLNTDLIGIYVPGKNITIGLQDEGDKQNLHTPPKQEKDTPPKQDLLNKVLTSEVLTNILPNGNSQKKELGSELVLSSELPNTKAVGKKELLYQACVEFWLKEVHPGWTFSAMHGKAMKSIISKMRTLCLSKQLIGSDAQILNSFKKMCMELPEWFKEKDLPIINAKFNEITTQIQHGPKQQSYHSKNSADRFSRFAS